MKTKRISGLDIEVSLQELFETFLETKFPTIKGALFTVDQVFSHERDCEIPLTSNYRIKVRENFPTGEQK